MKLKQNYIKCFTLEKSEQLNNSGYKFLYEKDGVYWYEDNNSLTVKFSNTDLLNDTKSSMWINL